MSAAAAKASGGAERRVRVGHVLNTIGLGGVPEVAGALLCRLPADRFERHLFVLNQPEGEAEARAARLARWVDAGVQVRFADVQGGVLGRQAALATWLSDWQIQVLHTHSYKPNLHARLAALALGDPGLRIVAHYHNQYDNKWAADGSLTLDARLAARTDALLACSHAVARHLVERLGVAPSEVQVLTNGVDTDRFRRIDPVEARRRLGLAEPEAAGPWIGVVGRLCHQKGQDLFLEAAALLARDLPQARWLLIGAADEADHEAALRARAEALGLAPARLHWLGHCQDMPAAYSALDLLVAPSRWEGFGLMLVEALACGTPIVACRVGAVPEVLAGSGPRSRLVPPEDVPALATAIAAAVAPASSGSASGGAAPAAAHAERTVPRFSWDRSAAELATLYQRLVDRPPRRRRP